MAVEPKAFVSVEEYLHTSYEPDCDYVDGELVDRHTGMRDHSRMLVQVSAYLGTRYEGAGFEVLVVLTMQVSPTRFRVADVCVVRVEPVIEQILTRPPLIVIEILAPEDRVMAMQQKIDDYVAFGVPNIWLIDPETRRAFICTGEGWLESKDLVLRTTDGSIVLPLPEVFARL